MGRGGGREGRSALKAAPSPFTRSLLAEGSWFDRVFLRVCAGVRVGEALGGGGAALRAPGWRGLDGEVEWLGMG